MKARILYQSAGLGYEEYEAIHTLEWNSPPPCVDDDFHCFIPFDGSSNLYKVKSVAWEVNKSSEASLQITIG